MTHIYYVQSPTNRLTKLLKFHATKWGNLADSVVHSRYECSLQGNREHLEAIDKHPCFPKAAVIDPGKPAANAQPVFQDDKVLSRTRSSGNQRFVKITVKRTKETNPPAGCEAVTCRFLTKSLVSRAERVTETIDWCRCHREIESFVDILITSCRVERLQPGANERIKKALILSQIVSERILYWMRLGKNCPDLPADLVPFNGIEYRNVFLADGLENQNS